MLQRRFPSLLPAVALRGLLLLLLVVAVGSTRAAEVEAAGRVILTLGEALAVDPTGNERELGRGDAFDTGDTLRTGPEGRMQLRFTDGSRMALRPDSELVVEDYAFDESSSAASSNTQRMRLNRGGFRTVTGRIAETNREGYRVLSPFAVIGVRGTDYSLVIEGGNLLLGVIEGGIFAANDGGEIDLGEGQDFDFAVVTSFDEAPEGLDEAPEALGDVLSLEPGTADDDVSASAEDEGEGEGPQTAEGDGGPDGGQDDDGSVQVAGGVGPDGEGPLLVIRPGSGGDEETVFAIQQRCL